VLITIIEALVPSNKWSDLEIEYEKKIKHVPEQLRETYLIHDVNHQDVWRIISIWRSKEGYKEAASHQLCDACTEIFRALNIEATRRLFDVPAHHMQV
jgi:hypothetical protein